MSAHSDAGVTRLLLIRHGEASGNRELRYLGATDALLTPTGAEQASRLADALRLAPIGAIYASPLARARATAEALAVVRNPALTPQLDARLREQDYGAWEGLTRAEAQARDPKAHAAWEAGAEVAPPTGESLDALRARSIDCAQELAQRHAGEVIALVSHVGPIKALVCAALGLPPHAARRMWLTPASVCILDWQAGEHTDNVAAVLRLFNGKPDLSALAEAPNPA